MGTAAPTGKGYDIGRESTKGAVTGNASAHTARELTAQCRLRVCADMHDRGHCKQRRLLRPTFEPPGMVRMRATPAAEPSATNSCRKYCRIHELIDCIALATHTRLPSGVTLASLLSKHAEPPEPPWSIALW